jgi:hypothetical protein
VCRGSWKLMLSGCAELLSVTDVFSSALCSACTSGSRMRTP